MTEEELVALFEAEDDTWKLSFSKDFPEDQKLHKDNEMHVFLRLWQIMPEGGMRGTLGGADHDIVWLGARLDKLAEVATPELVRELKLCGVHYSEDSLAMFV